jgi:hypothetical protein
MNNTSNFVARELSVAARRWNFRAFLIDCYMIVFIIWFNKNCDLALMDWKILDIMFT